jgi:hypothetical protein
MHACLFSKKVAGSGRGWVERIEVVGGSIRRKRGVGLEQSPVNLKNGFAQKSDEKGANSLALVNRKTHFESFPRMNFLGSPNEIHSA